MARHKRSVTIELMTAAARFGLAGTDEAGLAAKALRQRLQPALEQRVWAVEGSQRDAPRRRSGC